MKTRTREKGRGEWFFKKISSRESILILLILSDKTKKKGMFSFLPAIVRWVKQTKLFQIQGYSCKNGNAPNFG